MASDRYRNFKFVVWKESMPSDVWTKCDEANIKMLISPLHDQDVDKMGNKKKAHYHGIYMAPGKKTFDSAKEIVQTIFGKSVNTVFVCDDVGSAARYFFHLDSPDKYAYHIEPASKSYDGYRTFGGVDMENALRMSSDLKKYDRQIYNLIEDQDIKYYDDLCLYAGFVNTEWRNAVTARTMHWVNYLKARTEKINKGIRPSPLRHEIDVIRKEIFDET